MAVVVEDAVARLIDARLHHHTVAPLSETYGDFGLEEAYAIQDALRSRLGEAAEKPTGWKLAATSATGQAIMGVTEPSYGFLPRRRYASGAPVTASDFTDLRVEAEVAFRIGTRLAGPGVTARAAREAIEGAFPAFELLDFIYSGTPRAGDFIANSIHGKAAAIGSTVTPLEGLDLALEAVVLEHNGELVGTYMAAEVMGDPINALAWLANKMATHGRALEPGDVVISGGITKMLRPVAGDTICARFTHLGAIEMKVVA